MCIKSFTNLRLTKKVKNKQLEAYIIEADKRLKRVYFLNDAGRDMNSTVTLDENGAYCNYCCIKTKRRPAATTIIRTQKGTSGIKGRGRLY